MTSLEKYYKNSSIQNRQLSCSIHLFPLRLRVS